MFHIVEGAICQPYHLLCDHDYRLRREPSIAVVEKVFERGPKKVNDEDIMKALLPKVIDIRYTGCPLLGKFNLIYHDIYLRQPTSIL